MQHSMGPATRPHGNDKAMGAQGIQNKRKKMLKINIKAANNVADDSNFYN